MTVKQYASKVGATVPTVYNWIRWGLIKAEKKTALWMEYWEIEEDAEPPSLRRGRPRTGGRGEVATNGHRRSNPWKDQLEAERNFNGNKRTCKLNYQQLQVRFENGETLEQIGKEAGVTRERIRQYFKVYFKQFLGENFRPEIRKKNKTAKIKAEVYERAEERITLAKLKVVAEEFEWEFEPLAVQRQGAGRVIYGAHSSRVLINGKKIYYKTLTSRGKFKITGGMRCYHRISITLGQIEWADYLVIMEDSLERPDRAFVIPTEVVKDEKAGKWTDEGHKMLYVPLEKLPVYNNQYSLIDWWEWEDRWDLIGG